MSIPEEPPGKRDVKDKFGQSYTTTEASKGKLYKTKLADRRKAGARRRSQSAQGGMYGVGSSTKVTPGKKDLDSLYEELDSNHYDEQEEKIFKENVEVKKLIESLENSTNEV